MKFWLKLGLSIALLVVLFTYVVDGREVVRIVRDFHPGYLLLALFVVTIDRLLMAYKWTVLLRAQGYRLPLLQAVTIYCTSMIWGMALPTTVGADAIRAVMTTKRGLGGADVVTSIVIERMVGFVLALALGVICLLILRNIGVLDASFDKAFWLGIVMIVGVVGLLALSMNETATSAVMVRLPRALRESKVMDHLRRFAAAYRSLGSARGAIARFGGLTVIEQLVSVLFPWTLALGLGVPVDLLVLLGVLPLSTLLSRVPISFDGIGVFEVIFVGLMTLAGVAPEASLAIALSGRVIQLFAFLPWWLVYVLQSGAISPPTQQFNQAPPQARATSGLK